MDSDRKYKQRGYMDENRDNGRTFDDRAKAQAPKPPIDVTGPRLPRLVQAVTASRCYNCAATLPQDVNWTGICPKCSAALHCCKQCSHFEPSTRFQCLKPILVRVALKDQANTCDLFKGRVTVARDTAANGAAAPSTNGGPKVPDPRSANDARAAFDSLFKKS